MSAAAPGGAPPPPARAVFEVVHSPTVMVRDSPSLSATAVGFCSPGERVTATGRCGEWLRLAGVAFGGRSLPESVREAWMMWEHPKFGRLVRQVSGGRLPSVTLALEPALMTAGPGRQQYQQWAKSLAATINNVAAQLVDQRNVRMQPLQD